jgi:hypothetical protein
VPLRKAKGCKVAQIPFGVRLSEDSSQVLVILETKKFILNFEPISWFWHENCYVSFSVSL